MNVKEIDAYLSSVPMASLNHEMNVFRCDPRAGVQKLLEKYERKLDAYREELIRLDNMMIYERKYQDYGLIAGIDEAGRGPLAGPVVAGAVILPKDHPILYVNDSKQLSEKKREELYDVILRDAVAWGTGMAGEGVIDEINILQATYRAMQEAYLKLSPAPAVTLNDAVTVPGITVRQVPIIKGDAKSASIAAASIVAKVTRDRLMVKYDALYPEYGFAKHKGYGSKEHIEALKKYGPCPIHRKTFIRGILGLDDE
ncbi:MAG: ribonuclease HII [Lachnospiraceae bacterium]|nr:ribonuclease HII [Lachnospiraceae bacterium]